MKRALLIAVLSCIASQSQAMLLQCERGEIRAMKVNLVDDQSCGASGLAAVARDVRTCVVTSVANLEAGNYQICGSKTAHPDFFFIRLAIDSSLR